MFRREDYLSHDEWAALHQRDCDELADDPSAHPGRWERRVARDLGYNWRSGTVSPLGAAAPPPFKDAA